MHQLISANSQLQQTANHVAPQSTYKACKPDYFDHVYIAAGGCDASSVPEMAALKGFSFTTVVPDTLAINAQLTAFYNNCVQKGISDYTTGLTLKRMG